MVTNKKETKKLAKKLAKRLKNKLGGEWQYRVWENGGWCYDVHLGTISVNEYIYDTTSYSALISSDLNVSNYGLSAWTDNNNSADTPEKAVVNAMKSATKYALELNAVLADNYNKIFG